jgi:hypothetical protein
MSLLYASSRYIGLTEGYFLRMNDLAYPINYFLTSRFVMYLATSITSKAYIFS